MIKTLTCVRIMCDTCQEGFGPEDYAAHFSSVAEAIEVAGLSEHVEEGHRISSWLIGEDGSATCDLCRQQAREAACPSHEWDDEPYPWRYCRLCHAWFRRDGTKSTDQETPEESAALVDRNLRAMGSEGLQSTDQEAK